MKSKVIQLYYYKNKPETKEKSMARIKNGHFHALIDSICSAIPSL